MAKKIKMEPSMHESFMRSHHDDRDKPIDLSRYCDSVESRKTPSPYTSSNSADSPASMINDSPTTLSRKVRAKLANQQFQRTNLHPITDFTETHSSALSNYMKNSLCEKPQLPEQIKYFDYPNISSPPNIMTGSVGMTTLALQELKQKLANVEQTPLQNMESILPRSMAMNMNGKKTRPFKAYPNHPLSMESSVATEARFSIFREQMLAQMYASNGGPITTNPNMSRTGSMQCSREIAEAMDADQETLDPIKISSTNSSSFGSVKGDEQIKDIAYLERRRKNNAAAKKSRDRRRMKEDEIAVKAAFLQRENIRLNFELDSCKQQLLAYMRPQ